VIERNKLPFTILSDEERSVTKRLGLLHATGSPEGKDVPIPAHFLIDRQGRIIWEHVATKIPDRPDPEDVINIIRSKL
jgi:peroxiredoxin